MQKGHNLQFTCQRCKEPVLFSLFELNSTPPIVICPSCEQKYSFDDPTLLRQLQKFVDLCKQIHASEEILSSASIGIDVGDHSVQVPYRLLLTRLSSHLNLCIGKTPISIAFRIEPAEELSAELVH